VRHVKTDAANEENRGIGLKFINIDEQSRQALINYIRSQGNCI
jgi:c-di-GMP-binding flagellar brake protein YcgR